MGSTVGQIAKIKGCRVIGIAGGKENTTNKARIIGPSNYLSLLVNRATMQGMVVFDFADQYGKAAKEMDQWLAEGKLKSKEDIYEGIENFRDTYDRLFTGNKLGKLVLKVKES